MPPQEDTRRWWQQRLGAVADPEGSWRPGGRRPVTL